MRRIIVFLAVQSCILAVGCTDRPAGVPSAGGQVAAGAAADPPASDPSTASPQSATETSVTEPSATESNRSQASEPEPAGNGPAEGTPLPRSASPPGTVQRISFDDLNCGMQADIVFREWMLTDRVKELDGHMVRVSGYMNPDVKQQGITEFILLRNTECKFGPSGQADHLIRVQLEAGVTTSFRNQPVEVTGKLMVNPFTGPDGKTWSIFDMTGKSVEPYRR